MKYDRKYAGKWVAVKDDTIIALRQQERTLYCTYMNKFMTATEARKKWYAIIDEAEHPGVAVAITHEGIPKVVVMSFEEYEGWMETMEIMADPELDKELRQAVKDKKAGKLHKDTVSFEEAKKRLKL